MKRAAISISSNIAEGSSRRTAKERRHFIDIAIGSLFEANAQLIIATELGFLPEEKLQQAEDFIEKLKAKLLAFSNSMKNRPTVTSNV